MSDGNSDSTGFEHRKTVAQIPAALRRNTLVRRLVVVRSEARWHIHAPKAGVQLRCQHPHPGLEVVSKHPIHRGPGTPSPGRALIRSLIVAIVA